PRLQLSCADRIKSWPDAGRADMIRAAKMAEYAINRLALPISMQVINLSPTIVLIASTSPASKGFCTYESIAI
ncbi:MAG: hypothetical protein LUO92_03955, partial [Methanothrix sp.]|nr:hypothetical protein [Methanothrix sp.]